MEENKPNRVPRTTSKVKKKNPVFGKGKDFLKSKVGKEIRDSLFILGGVISATIGLEGFIVPNKYLDGGAVGISLLLTNLTGIGLSIYIFIINLPFIVMAYYSVSRKFAIKTFLSIIALSIALEIVHFFIHPEPITKDPMLIAIFGGFFLGTGIGLAIRGGSVIDGTEVLALYLGKKAGMQIGEVILLINIFIFSVAIFVFGHEIAMYSTVTYLSASKTVDFITNGIEEYIGVTIVSGEHKAIRKAIISKMGRGVTIYKGSRGLRGKVAKESGLDDRDILFTVVTKLELSKLKSEIEAIDPGCFVLQQSINSVKGGMVKKRSFH